MPYFVKQCACKCKCECKDGPSGGGLKGVALWTYHSSLQPNSMQEKKEGSQPKKEGGHAMRHALASVRSQLSRSQLGEGRTKNARQQPRRRCLLSGRIFQLVLRSGLSKQTKTRILKKCGGREARVRDGTGADWTQIGCGQGKGPDPSGLCRNVLYSIHFRDQSSASRSKALRTSQTHEFRLRSWIRHRISAVPSTRTRRKCRRPPSRRS